MPIIKLFRVHDVNFYDEDYCTVASVLSDGVSDWEEVSNEELELLKGHLHLLQRGRGKLVIIEQASSAQGYIKDIKAELRRLAKEEEKRREAERLRREEAAVKRAQKKLERDRKALEKLIAANPDLVKEVVSQ